MRGLLTGEKIGRIGFDGWLARTGGPPVPTFYSAAPACSEYEGIKAG